MSKRNWKLFEKSWGTEARVDESSRCSPSDVAPSWSVEETQNLPGLLFPGAAGGDAMPGIVARRMTDVPGIAAMAYGLEAQSVLALTTPVTLGQISADEAAAALRELFLRATQIAERSGCEWLRCLVSHSEAQQDDTVRVLRSALLQFGFSCLAEIGEWCREYSTKHREELHQHDDSSDVVWEYVSQEQLDDEYFHAEMNTVLEDILSTSSDLPNLPRPLAADMISRWRNAGTKILLLRVREIPAGICAFDKMLEEGLSDSYLSLRLQYVGIVPALRQQGLGRCLIRALISDCLKQHSCVVLSVTADRSNTSAVGLYESLGCQRQSVHEVWMKRLEVSFAEGSVCESGEPPRR